LILNKLVIRNIVIAVLLIILLGVVYMVRNRSPFGKSQTLFSTNPRHEITRVEITSEGKKLTLEKSGNEWKVNNKYEARNNTVSFLIDILKEMKIKSPVSEELFEKEIVSRNVKPVRVRVFDGNRHLRSFLVFTTGSNIYGNIMKRRPGAKPFIVSVPGLESDIGSMFTTDEHFWRPYIIFNTLPSQISSVTVENLTDPGSSFRIEINSGRFNLYCGDSLLTGWNPLRLRRYLSYFTMVPFERWAMEQTGDKKKKIEDRQPLFRISLASTDGSKKYLTLWEKQLDSNGTKDTDRLWGKIGESDGILVIRYFDIDPVLKKKAYFYTQ